MSFSEDITITQKRLICYVLRKGHNNNPKKVDMLSNKETKMEACLSLFMCKIMIHDFSLLFIQKKNQQIRKLSIIT